MAKLTCCSMRICNGIIIPRLKLKENKIEEKLLICNLPLLACLLFCKKFQRMRKMERYSENKLAFNR